MEVRKAIRLAVVCLALIGLGANGLFAVDSPFDQYRLRLEQSLNQLQQLPLIPDNISARIDAMHLVGENYRKTGAYAEAYDYHHRALALHLESGLQAKLGLSYRYMGYILGELGDYDLAVDHMETSIKLMQVHMAETDAFGQTFMVYSGLINVVGNSEKAQELAHRGLKQLSKRHDISSILFQEAMASFHVLQLMITMPDIVDAQEVIDALEKVQAALMKDEANQSLSLARVHWMFGKIYLAIGDARKSREYFAMARKSYREIQGEWSPKAAELEVAMATALIQQGERDAARERLKTAQRIVRVFVRTLHALPKEIQNGYSEKFNCIDELLNSMDQGTSSLQRNCTFF